MAQNSSDAKIASSPLLKPTSEAGIAWTDTMTEPHVLLCAAMNVMHPSQVQCMDRLRRALVEHQQVVHAVERWTATPFNALSIIANRETPFHRDPKTHVRCYDGMVSVGPYRGAKLVMETLGVIVENSPGTLVAAPGKVVIHGTSRAVGDRICYAYYCREAVFERMGTMLPQWPLQRTYGPCIGPHAPNLIAHLLCD